MKPVLSSIILFICIVPIKKAIGQEDTSWCKVKIKNLVGTYTGGCKLGLADGKGDARGIEHYIGSFKNGLPDGSGTYYYADSTYHTGNFQDGIKEGKGETHYPRKGMPDSVLKGYWSADEYRGKRYVTYFFRTTENFDLMEITPSGHSGSTVTIEISTTSGSPSGANPGYVLSLVDLVSPIGCILKMTTKVASAFKSYTTFELTSFPCKLFGTLSSNATFELELYKAADWKVRLFKNK